MMQRVLYGSTVLKFSLERHTKSTLRITVQPDLSVQVTAPNEADLESVKERVLNKAAWIRKQQRQFELYLPKPTERLYVTGESYRYLGRQYRLRVIGDSANPGVALCRGQLEVRHVGHATPEATKRSMERWYADKASAKLKERFEHYLPLASRFDLKPPHLVIRRMDKRWGSCTRQGRILLNPELIKAPVDCIDYVILHELCHLREHSHGARFIRLLTRILPDWKRSKARLEKVEL